MSKFGKPYKHSDLPPRSDPNYMKLYREKFKETSKIKQKEKLKRLLEENPNYWKERYDPIKAAEYRAKTKPISTERQWKNRGIIDLTYDKFQNQLNEQSNKCLICEKEMKIPHADHCHKSGKFRGILCTFCNNGLGVYEKYKDKFQKYLNENG